MGMNIDINLENCDQEYRVALFLSAGAKIASGV